MTRHAPLAWMAILTLAACTAPEPAPSPVASAAPVATAPSAAPAHESPHWTYEGAAGPQAWGTLGTDFAKCASGRSQSPIDIGKTSSAELPALRSAFRPAKLTIAHTEHVADAINNGHTIEVDYPAGDTLTVGDTSYTLVQYHFHAPSEHTVAGKHAPMEMHLVHKSEAGGLAVVGVLIEEGAANAAFDPIWSNLPKAAGARSHLEHVEVDVDQLLPKTRTTWRYDGSLTTPPCSEDVKWLVMTTPVHLSAAQIAAFTAIVEPNNRPVQPLNDRVVATDRVAEAR